VLVVRQLSKSRVKFNEAGIPRGLNCPSSPFRYQSGPRENFTRRVYVVVHIVIVAKPSSCNLVRRSNTFATSSPSRFPIAFPSACPALTLCACLNSRRCRTFEPDIVVYSELYPFTSSKTNFRQCWSTIPLLPEDALINKCYLTILRVILMLSQSRTVFCTSERPWSKQRFVNH
jgi:hypothetical protein